MLNDKNNESFSRAFRPCPVDPDPRIANSDFCLVELAQKPPANSNITFAGWSKANVASLAGASITHPRGDVMKIAIYNQVITQETMRSPDRSPKLWIFTLLFQGGKTQSRPGTLIPSGFVIVYHLKVIPLGFEPRTLTLKV